MFTLALEHAHAAYDLAANIGPQNPVPPPGEAGSKFQSLFNLLLWFVVAALGCAGLIAAAILGWQRYQGEGGGPGESKLIKVAVGAVLAGSVVGIVNWLALG